MDSEEICQFFGAQRRQHVWGANDGDWGIAMVQHYQQKAAHSSTHPSNHDNPTIPRILHLIWLGPRPFPNEALLESWRYHHGDWDIRIWTNDKIPTDLHNHDAFHYALQHNLYGMASDILRMELLHHYGGVYVDVDYLCVASLSCFDKYEFYCGASHVGCIEVNNGILAARPQSPIVQNAMQQVHQWFQVHGRPLAIISSFMGNNGTAASLLSHDDIVRHTGPGLWTRILGTLFVQQQDRLPETIMVFPYTVFHPMPNTDRHYDHDDYSERQLVETYATDVSTKAIHLWHCSWQTNE